VCFCLPAHLAPQAQPAEAQSPSAAPAPAAATAGSGVSRILVVDDLAASAETLMMLLEMEGFEVRVAHEGQAALAIAQEFRPQAVLLDIGLPGMNGFEVAKRSRGAGYAGMLVALTGYGQGTDIKRSLQAGFDAHLVKPLDAERLRRLLVDGPTFG
jgi:DNA-binding response OmpR family regulator